MSKQSIRRIVLLSLWSIIYIILCVICINLIGLNFDFVNRHYLNIFRICCLLSIPIWFVLLCGFSKFDGSTRKWWSKILYDPLKQHPCLIPYEELPEVEKAYDRDTALGTLKLISKLGL